tara:strand:- start:331 stop:726 length:396 start_codon:yes stop_codon:yes gene_type:complete
MQLGIFKRDFIEYKTLVYWNKIDLKERVFVNYKINKKGNIKNQKDRFISQTITELGYKRAALWLNGKSYIVVVHRAMACTFLINNNKKLFKYVNHIDEDRLNNNLSNLEWVSARGNQIARYKSTQLKLPLD